jgi:cellulose synthase/poly-beta-1,6-N-acetylglucosamine synthase-like glycosyltransferase
VIWATISLTVVQLYLAFLIGYLLLLVAASHKAARSEAYSPTEAGRKFLILIPAHNEERLLPDLLVSLARLDYPSGLFAVHVVADNCTDQTALAARRTIAQVHIRSDREHLGKGHALNWLLARLQQGGEPHDAVVFLDADSVVSPNFLRIMSAHLERDERAIQAYYSVRDPGLSWAGSLRYAALAVLHFLRPQGRMALGTSAGLKGNGMVFSADLMKRFTWSSSVTEDIELHMDLLINGERVTFAPEAIVWGEMPDNLSNSTSQHMRWEQGRKQMARSYIPRLLAAGWQELRTGRPRRAFLLWDAVMEFIEPPFSILAGVNLLTLLASLVFFGWELSNASRNPLGAAGRLAALNVLLAAVMLLGQMVYLFAGLRSVSAPKQVYLNLLFAPRLMLWKTWQVFQVMLGRGQNTWIRTKRNRG